MKTDKKALSLILALVMLTGLMVVPAFAEDPEPSPSTDPSPSPSPTETGIDADPDIDTKYVIEFTTAAPVAAETNGQTDKTVTTTLPTKTTLYIDLSKETITIPESYKVAAYSLDGGTKWMPKTLTAGDISKLLNKGMTLHLTDAYDKKAKGPQAGVKGTPGDAAASPPVEAITEVPAATVVKFPEIKARPAMDKLMVNYLVGADLSGATNGTWKLTVKDAEKADDTLIGKLQGVQPKGKKFDAANDTWGKFAAAGVPVKNMENGKAVKTTYFYRLAPDVGTLIPASKTLKVVATSVAKAPSLKPDYKKEVLKTKKDTMLYFGPRDEDAPDSGEKGGFTILAEMDVLGEDGKFYDGMIIPDKIAAEGLFYGPVDPSDKEPIQLGEYLSEQESYITVWINATAKKPASMKQEITLATRAYLPNSVVAAEKGKVKLDKTLEVYDSSKQKYGKLPKAEGAVTGIGIRLKNTAKAGSADKTKATLSYEGLAASKPGKISVTYGVYETKLDKDGEVRSTKNGYLEAGIIAPHYPGRVALVNPRIVLSAAGNAEIGDSDKAAMEAAFVTDGAAATYAVAYDVYGMYGGNTLATAAANDAIKAVAAPEKAGVVAFGGTITYTESGFDATTHAYTPGKVVFPFADTFLSADKVDVEITLELGTGGDAPTNTYNEENFYWAPFSFEVAKKVITPTFDATAHSTGVDGTKLNLAAAGTVTINVTGLAAADYTVTASKGTETVSVTKEADKFTVPFTDETGDFTIKIELTADAKTKYELAEGKDTFTVSIPEAPAGT